MSDSYHHGDLRSAILAQVKDVVLTHGVHAVSLRGLATALGVSHTAPRHHFGSLEGVFTAFAAEGARLLEATISEAINAGGDFLEVGVAYARFALENPAHFEVMFQPELITQDDPEYVAARTAAFSHLTKGVSLEERGGNQDAEADLVAAWSLMHGVATLYLGGNLRQFVGEGAEAQRLVLDLARRAGQKLSF